MDCLSWETIYRVLNNFQIKICIFSQFFSLRFEQMLKKTTKRFSNFKRSTVSLEDIFETYTIGNEMREFQMYFESSNELSIVGNIWRQRHFIELRWARILKFVLKQRSSVLGFVNAWPKKPYTLKCSSNICMIKASILTQLNSSAFHNKTDLTNNQSQSILYIFHYKVF